MQSVHACMKYEGKNIFYLYVFCYVLWDSIALTQQFDLNFIYFLYISVIVLEIRPGCFEYINAVCY